MPVIDPTTDLEADVPLHANLLLELLLDHNVQAVLVARCRATPEGITFNVKMLKHAVNIGIGNKNPFACRCKAPHDKAWWRQYAEHVRTFLCEALEDPKVRKAVAIQQAWGRNAPYKQVIGELRALRNELNVRREMLRAGDKAGIILVES